MRVCLFLMETASLVDSIMSCMAITFILDMDELIYALSDVKPIRYLMASVEELELAYDQDSDITPGTDEEIFDRVTKGSDTTAIGAANLFWTAVPWRLVLILVIQCGCTWLYFASRCHPLPGGGGLLVSNPIYYPVSPGFSALDFFYKLVTFSLSRAGDTDELAWRMPDQIAMFGAAFGAGDVSANASASGVP